MNRGEGEEDLVKNNLHWKKQTLEIKNFSCFFMFK